MSVPLLLLLLAPLVGAVVAITFADFPSQRRPLVAVCTAAMLGGAVAGLVRSAGADPVTWRGFSMDAWSAILVLGAVVAMVAGVAHVGGRSDAATAEASLFVAGASGIVPLLVGKTHLLAVTMPVSTLAFACAAVASARRETLGTTERRAVAALALSDVLAIIAIGATLASGTALPAKPSVGAAALLLAAIGLRLGLVPLGWGSEDALRSDPSLGAVWLGPVRAQALFLLPAAVGAGQGVAYAAAAAAGLTAVVSTVRGARDPGLGPLTTTGVSFVVLGVALGGAPALWGAVLCAAAVFLATPAWFAAGAAREGVRPTLGALPAGALIPGAVLVVSAAFDAAAQRPAFLAFALPAAVSLLVLMGIVASGVPDPRSRGDRLLGPIWGWASVAAAAAIATVPVRVTHGLALPAADALGVGRLLRAGPEPGVIDELAILIVGVAVVAFVVGPGRAGLGGPPSRRSAPLLPTLEARFRMSFAIESRHWTTAAAVLIAASIGVAIRVYVVAAGRGFL